MKNCPLFIWIGFCIVFIGPSLTYAQQALPDAVEIVVDGKPYESIHEYRLEQIKDLLISALATVDLKAFTKEELYKVIKEVRNQQDFDTSSTGLDKPSHLRLDDQRKSQKNREKTGFSLESFEMEEMLTNYFDKHEGEDPIFLDPTKVKSILIESK